MTTIFTRETGKLKERLLRMAAEIEKRMTALLEAIASHDEAVLQSIIANDADIDAAEIEIEEECLKLLALHQPVARDLRFIIAVLKMNNDLERIGDILVNIADRGCRLHAHYEDDIFLSIREMGGLAAEQVRESLACLLTLDVPRAVAVIQRDDKLDAMNAGVIKSITDRASASSCNREVGALFLYHSMARDLERIGDHATNIAEDVAYLVDGRIVRHGNLNLSNRNGDKHGQNTHSDR